MAFTRDEITDILFQAVGKAIKRNPSELSTDMSWIDDLDFKSVQGMKVCGILNYKLGITVPLSSLIECTTLGDAVDMLEKLAG